MPLVFMYSRFSGVARGKFKHLIVGKIQDVRHLTRSNKVRVKHYNFEKNRRRFITEWEISIVGSNIYQCIQ